MTSHHSDNPVWFPFGDQALILDFTGFKPVLLAGDKITLDDETAQEIRTLASQLRALSLEGVTEIVPSLTRLLIRFDSLQTSAEIIKRQVTVLRLQMDSLAGDEPDLLPPRNWLLPVCYDGDCGPDIDEVAERTGFTADEVIACHLANQLEVSVMGFMPGNGYMTGVDERLTLPRRKNPRPAVPERSVGIAIGQCVIYPLTSPGGWHLIGRVAYPLFDPARAEPILLRTGDKVRFVRIDQDELARQEAAYAQGTLVADDLIDAGA